MLSRLEELKKEFNRYLFADAMRSRGGFGFGFGSVFGMSDSSRSEVSEIIKNLVYLTNLRNINPYKSISGDVEVDAALVVSCVDIPELAESKLLLEPGAQKIKFHVIAMTDVSGKVGSVDHIYDALVLMSEFASLQKPIHIHCREGVGRSAMITALHIAHRYLLGDASALNAIDSVTGNKPLNPDSGVFIRDLYHAAAAFVLSKRKCCQFNHSGRNEFAISVLTEVNNKIKQNQAIVGHRDENYYFLAAFVQSPEYKKFQYYLYDSFGDKQELVNKLMSEFVLNQDGWYQNLVAEASENTADEKSIKGSEWCALLRGVLQVFDRLILKFPKALYSEQVVLHHDKQTQLSDEKQSHYSISYTNH